MNEDFRNKFLEERKKKEEKILNNRMEKKVSKIKGLSNSEGN